MAASLLVNTTPLGMHGKTEDQIIEQIIGLVNDDDDELGDILKSYEESPGLNELIENMSAFFTVQ